MHIEVVRAGADRVAELADEHVGFHTYLESDAPDGGPHIWFIAPIRRCRGELLGSMP